MVMTTKIRVNKIAAVILHDALAFSANHSPFQVRKAATCVELLMMEVPKDAARF
jgi:hypothetical protein